MTTKRKQRTELPREAWEYEYIGELMADVKESVQARLKKKVTFYFDDMKIEVRPRPVSGAERQRRYMERKNGTTKSRKN